MNNIIHLKVIANSLKEKVENVHKEQRTFLILGPSFSECFVLLRHLIFLDLQDLKHSP